MSDEELFMSDVAQAARQMPAILKWAVADELERLTDGLCCASELWEGIDGLRAQAREEYRKALDNKSDTVVDSLQVRDLTGKVVVLRSASAIRQDTLGSLGQLVSAAGGLLLVLDTNTTLLTLDETQMAGHGWVRAT